MSIQVMYVGPNNQFLIIIIQRIFFMNIYRKKRKMSNFTFDLLKSDIIF